MENFGLIKEEKKIGDWVAGGFTPLDEADTNPYFWERFLPLVEKQVLIYFDTYACVIFSGLNLLETLICHKTHREVNFSDQYSAIFSNLRNYTGTTYNEFWSAVREYGLLPQNKLAFTGKTWEEWVSKDNVTPEMTIEALSFFDEWDLYHEWVKLNPTDMYQELFKSPLQVSVRFANGEEILNPEGNTNHAVMIYSAVEGKYWEIFDHYTQTRKKYAWNYKFGACKKAILIKKNIYMPNIKNNTLVQLVEGVGGFGLYLDDKLYVDDLAKIQASWLMRNHGDVKDKTLELTDAEWKKLEKFNLKGEKIN